jgi:NAD(P)-dependent dehydrogenase (short-subunit alcohol dehydrogenase family)
MSQSDAVLVTGGADGLGRATVDRLARDGYPVVVTDVNGPGAQAAAAEINERGQTALGLKMDVTDPASVDGAVTRAVSEFGGLIGLVNNAGVGRAVPFLEMSEADWDWVFQVNCKGTFLTSKAVLPHLVAQGRGSVVNMSSIAGRDGYPLWAHYTASKHAIIGLTRALARELGPMGVRVNAVCPGAIATQMWGAEAQQTDDPEAALATMAASMPLRRPQTAADVAAAVAFLLSDDAASITGQSLGVDGGLVM